MLFKLLPDILDRLDVFVMEVEELEIPKAGNKAKTLPRRDSQLIIEPSQSGGSTGGA